MGPAPVCSPTGVRTRLKSGRNGGLNVINYTGYKLLALECPTQQHLPVPCSSLKNLRHGSTQSMPLCWQDYCDSTLRLLHTILLHTVHPVHLITRLSSSSTTTLPALRLRCFARRTCIWSADWPAEGDSAGMQSGSTWCKQRYAKLGGWVNHLAAGPHNDLWSILAAAGLCRRDHLKSN